MTTDKELFNLMAEGECTRLQLQRLSSLPLERALHLASNIYDYVTTGSELLPQCKQMIDSALQAVVAVTDRTSPHGYDHDVHLLDTILTIEGGDLQAACTNYSAYRDHFRDLRLDDSSETPLVVTRPPLQPEGWYVSREHATHYLITLYKRRRVAALTS